MPPTKRKDEEDEEVTSKKPKVDDEAENGDNVEGKSDMNMRIEGPSVDGEVLFCGGAHWDLTGRSKLPKGTKDVGGRNILHPHRLKNMVGIKVRNIVSSAMACHSILITTDGKAYSWGRNECGQLGHGDKDRRDLPTLIESLEDLNIVDAACGRNHTLVLSAEGHCYAFGDNRMGQLGLGHKNPIALHVNKINHKGPPIKLVGAGAEFSMIVDVRGNLFSFGSPEYGQLGHNTDGKYFVTSTKMGFHCENQPRRVQLFFEKNRDGSMVPVPDVEVQQISCGVNHALALDKKKRLFSWGFGGYGRLGHAEAKDEMVPRLIKVFEGPNRGAVNVQAGSQFSFAVNECGSLYFWGQTRSSGEATMYPKPVQDLNGWEIRSIGCGKTSTVVAADDSLVSWGPSPTCGELGYGTDGPKSSSVPKEVKTIHNAYILKVACGFAHTLLIARADSDEDKASLDKIPIFEPYTAK